MNIRELLSEDELKSASWAELLEETQAHFEDFYRRKGVPDPVGLSWDSVLMMCDLTGGQQIYFPKSDALRRKARDKEIYLLAGKESANKIARTYQLTAPTVYNIIKKGKEKWG